MTSLDPQASAQRCVDRHGGNAWLVRNGGLTFVVSAVTRSAVHVVEPGEKVQTVGPAMPMDDVPQEVLGQLAPFLRATSFRPMS